MDASTVSSTHDCDAGASEPTRANISLEDLLRADIRFDLNRKQTWTSSKADVPLPESRRSSIVDGFVSHSFHGSPSNEPTTESRLLSPRLNRSPTPKARRVRIEVPKDHVIKKPSSPREEQLAEHNEEPEPNPLWYRSQTFSHRYGSSRREPLLSPPLRASTLPAELPSRRNRLIERLPRQRLSNTPTPAVEQRISPPDPASRSRKSGPLESPRNRTNQSPFDANAPLKPTIGPFPPDDATPGHEIRKGRAIQSSNVPIAWTACATDARTAEPPKLPGPAQSSAQVRIVVPRTTSGTTEDNPNRIRRRGTGDTVDSLGRRSIRHGSEMTWVRRRTPRASSARKVTEIFAPDFNFHDYDKLIERLADHMPQLVNVRGDECRRIYNGAIYCYDTLESGGGPRLLDDISFSRYSRYPGYLASRVRDLKPNRVRNVRFRYILVEDLSPLVISCLGSTFWLNPEFFEEHLNQSGYRPDSYNDPHPRTWNTNETPKDYASVRWFRPVHRTRIRPLSELDRERLLTDQGEFKWKTNVEGAGLREKVVTLANNIFRREWPVVSDPDGAMMEDEDSTFPVGWEEKATVHISQSAGQPPTFIMLLDPLPSFAIQSEPSRGEYELAERTILFTQAYSRAPMGPGFGLTDVFDGNPLQERTIRQLASNLASTNCTREDLTSWLDSIHGAKSDGADMDMIIGLLWIIHRDVVGFLHFVSTTLEDIGLHATDDYLIQKRLAHWRHLISRFQTELPAMRSSIKNFFEFVAQYQPLDRAKDFIQRTLDLIDDLIEENEKSYAALRADMALLESKRAIDQAESVGKLTELGFIFIPISCIASLFSMQVQPLESPAPIYSFFVAAIVTIGLIYIIRLTIRSTALIEYKRELSRRIRIYTELPPGTPIPTRIFLLYMTKDVEFHKFLHKQIWRPFGIIILFISALAALMLPIIFLWTRNSHMDAGFKGMLTVLIFVFDAGVAFPFVIDILRKNGVIFNTSGSARGTDIRVTFGGAKGITSRWRSRSPSSSYYDTESKTSRRPKDGWQRGLVATADWLLGRRKKKSGAESTGDYMYSNYTSSSASASSGRTRQTRRRTCSSSSLNLNRNARDPRPYTYTPECIMNTGERRIVPTENHSHGEEELDESGPFRLTRRRRSTESFSDDDLYEQLAPGRTPILGQASEPATETFQDDAAPHSLHSGSSVSSASFDPNTAIVLYYHAVTAPQFNTIKRSAKASLPIDQVSLPSLDHSEGSLGNDDIGIKRSKGKEKALEHDVYPPSDISPNDAFYGRMLIEVEKAKEQGPHISPDSPSPADSNYLASVDGSLKEEASEYLRTTVDIEEIPDESPSPEE